MRFMVIATAEQKNYWQENFSSDIHVEFLTEESFLNKDNDPDIYFDLRIERDTFQAIETSKPVFINAVCRTLAELPENYIRINAWNTFFERGLAEIVSSQSNMEGVTQVMKDLQWKFQLVPDIPGMIASRIVSMIINEAYFTLADEISTKEEIDIAMRLGTNYPYGPFEWSKKIGLKNIYRLLDKMKSADSRYGICPLLKEDAFKNNF